MAASSPSSLASSEEKTNGAKLRRLLIDGGTAVLRNCFDSFHPPAKLVSGLHANSSMLNALLKKKVLRSVQMDQLFPRGGDLPDSKEFDITLLFLLLTNICGLTPPSSGWHSKPPVSDTSREANLARVKLFRNEFYGHVSTTGVEMSVFSSLWQEISTVLVDLGLDQGEIDKLKAEHIGEEDYIDLLREWSESEEDTKSQLRDIRNVQIQMHKDVVDLLQNQKEDQKTLEDTKSKLEEFSQCQVKTLEAVEEMQAGIEGFKQVAESEKKRREENREVEALKSLADVDFRGDIEYHVQRFQEGTREWIFQKIDGWLDDKSCENRVMVISGNAGMGKSVISAVVCQRMQEAGRLSGSHFCQHNNVRYRNPQLMLQSLASHLTHTLPEYKAALVEKLSRNLGVPLNSMGVEELFALLLKEPLHAIQDPGRNILMVIDGLDESEYQGRNELLDVIGKHFCKLPKWIRFLVTARPEINITESLKHLQPIHLNQKQEENLNDIKRFFELRLGKQLEQEHKNAFLDKLVQRTEGIFLFAYFLSAVLEENALPLTLEEVESRLPLGISSVYLEHFKRLEKELCKELKIEEDQVLRFLCALTASREPLPLAFASRILEPDGNCSISRRKVNKIIACISALLPIYHDRLHYIHKSVKDWLTNTSLYGRHKFIVDEKEGHEILFDLCNAELDKIKGKKLLDSQFNDAEQYALQHGVQHMTELYGLGNSSTTYIDHLVKSYVLDLELIFCRLCVNSMVPSDDLKSVQRNINVTSLQEGSCSSILYMSKALRKHSHLLRDHPEALFQSLVNEGPPELSVKAAQILENKLPHASYMKYLDKEEEQGVVLGRFCCSDTVACFDVSPEMDYMVCECRDGTIHLWSLQTGSEEWKRPSLIAKEFESTSRWGTLLHDEGAFRRVRRCVTFYRSVVFDGSGKYVLPGCLRNVYTLNGESYELFPKSDCVFSNCAFSGDRRTFLTDCGDDPKKLSLWSLENGAELYGIPLKEIIVSFALSQDGSLVAVTDDTGSVYVIHLDSMRGICFWQTKFVPCGLMHLSFDVEYTLVCGYLGTQLEDVGFQYRFVWNYENSDFQMCSFGKEDLFSSSAGVSWPLVPEGKFLLWPIDSSTLDLQDFYLQGDGETCLVENVSRVFPDLRVGFYARLSDNTILASGPSYNYVALVDVSHRDCSAKSSAVKEVVLSLEGDTLYSTCSDNGSSEVTVLRLSTREILMPKKSFAVPSLFLLSLKEGVVLCLGNGIPGLWNFELTRLIRPLPKLSGYERLSRISPALIACQRYSRHLTTEEFTSRIPSFEGTDLPEVVASNSNSSVDTETPSVVHDSTDVSDDAISPNPFDLLRMQQPMMHLSLITHRVLEVDIFNVTSEEFISSWKTNVYSDESIKFVYCNIRGEFLVCSCKEIDDDILDIDCEELTVWWRKNNSITKLWERKSRIYGGDSFSPQFLISPKEEFVVTWDSLYAGCGLHILDARCGETKHHLLKNRDDIVDCQFTCNDESLLCCTSDDFCRLFHLRTGDLLCLLDIEERPFSLGACTRNDLVAVGLSSGRLKFIHVKLPRRKESESKGSLTKTKWK